ncbi:MAG: hypothetical protein HOE69_06300, partial [Euryarchaeota archaeon]|nr:hypothetical protein [Euryarchaeota archaeon]
MSHHNNQVNRNRFRSIMLSCLMLIGALSAGIPNASALTGNETISGSALTNSSTTLSLGNLDTSDTYYWWVWISDSSGTVTDFDYGGPINSNFSSMTVQSSWTTPSTSGNYTVDAELTDANLTVLDSNVVGTFSISGGSGGTGGNGSQNDAGSGGDAGDNATAAYNLTVTSGSTYAGYADQTDAQDWYRIFVPTGKGITASMSFNGVTNGTNDLDLVLIDSTVSFYIDTSYYSNPEVVNSSGTNVSGQYVYLVVDAYSGFSYYNFTVTFYNVAGGSGGITADQYEINNDVGNATSVTLPFSPGSLTIHNSSDWDVFAISMTSGVTYWMNATFTHSVGDLDIYFTDSSLNIISYSESMTDNEATSWTANNTSTYYAIVMGYAGATNTYGLTLEGGSSNVTGDVSAIFYNQTYGDLTSLNLTSGSSYDLDVHLLVPNGTSFTSVASYTDSWASNGSNHISPAYITLAEENLFCLYGELYDMSHSAGGTYVDDDMDCLYHEMMEGFVTSDTSGTIDAQNLSSGSSYSYEWYLYIGGGTTYTQSGSGNFTAGSSSQSYNINWNQPGSGSVRCFTTYLFNATSVQIGQHEDCYYPTWPGIVATGVTANSNATTNTFYFDAIDLNIGVNYAVQTSIERYSNGTVIDFST